MEKEEIIVYEYCDLSTIEEKEYTQIWSLATETIV